MRPTTLNPVNRGNLRHQAECMHANCRKGPNISVERLRKVMDELVRRERSGTNRH